MRIDHLRALPGPNVHSHHPVWVMTFRVEPDDTLYGREAAPLLRAALALVAPDADLLPQDDPHLGHGVAQVTAHLATAAGYPPTMHTARREDEQTYTVVLGYAAEHATRYLLERAIDLLEAVAGGAAFEVAECLAKARGIAGDTELGPSTRAIVDAATARGIPWRRLSQESLIQLGHGRRRRLIQAATTDMTPSLSVAMVADKDLTKSILAQAAIPVPHGIRVHSADEAVAALAELGGPVVVKPLDGRQGKGVSLNLTRPEQMPSAFEAASRISDTVLVEEMFHGRDYRVLVVGGKMVAAAERRPAQVIGDGQRTITQLVAEANRDPRRGVGHEKPLTRIVIDRIADACLAKHGHSPDSVPAPGETVLLREGANLSTGGTATDVTDLVHPTTRKQCERAARLVGLDICGLDLIADDIAEPLQPGNGVIEVNAGPGLRMHVYPSYGQSRPVGEAIIDHLFPPGVPSRIPVVAITGTNGKTTTTRMIGHILAETGLTVGVTTTDGVSIGGETVASGDMTGPWSAHLVLSDPTVEAAVLETARGGIVRRGLGYDWSDVGVITNIQPDHIGQDGITCVDDLLTIKGLIAERVRPGGTVVLNAEDERLARLAERIVEQGDRRVALFALAPDHPVIRRHLRAGGTAFTLRDGWLVEMVGRRVEPLVAATALPVTLGGVAEYQIANALAAAAACRALSVSRRQVADALTRFSSALNPGRANLYRVGRGYIMLDYGHNINAFAETARAAKGWASRVTAVIAVPGDRADHVVEEAARVAAHSFDRLLIREANGLRGRPPLEVSHLMLAAARQAAPDKDCRVVMTEREAIVTAATEMVDGEGVMMYYEDKAACLAALAEVGALPVETVEARTAPAVPMEARPLSETWAAAPPLVEATTTTHAPPSAQPQPGGAAC